MHSEIDIAARKTWNETRSRLETTQAKERDRSSVHGSIKRNSKLPYHAFHTLLRLTGLYAVGERNARATRFREIDFTFADLPPAFDGYTMLHLTDIHVGQPPGLLEAVAETFAKLEPDLVVMTGDYQTGGTPNALITAREIQRLITAINSTDGCLAILGNHDRSDLVPALEDLGIRMLINEATEVRRAGDTLQFVGVDDVHSFFTSDAPACLDKYSDGFRIALVHSVDLASQAANAGYRLYLSGHSHGGQVCLPGGRPLLTSLDSHRHLAAGRWRLQDMQGYTNRGLGAQFPTVRFNCPGEAVMIRLKKAP